MDVRSGTGGKRVVADGQRLATGGQRGEKGGRRLATGEQRGERGERRVRDREVTELALRYRSGERGLLGELHRELEPLIRRFLQPQLASPLSLPPSMEVADLEQQAYVALAETVLDWRPGRSESLLPYFLSSFPRRVDRYLRSQTPSRRSDRTLLSSLPHDLLMASIEARPGEDGRDWDDAIGYSELLDELSSLETLVVHLHLYLGLSFAEISAMAGISRSGAHAAFARALSALRGSLET